MSTLVASNLQASGGGGTAATLASINGGPISGARNRIINGDMRIDQRNSAAAHAVTAGVPTYTIDRWIVSAAGAGVTGQQVTGATTNQFRYRVTGAAGVTSFAFVQRIEAQNSADLANTTITISADIANSLLTSVGWQLQYANTTDNFAAVTSIATGAWTVNSTVTRYSAQVSVPAAAMTGLQLAFNVGAQTSGTFTIGNVQLEAGSVATPFERRSYGQELQLCERYYEKSYPVDIAPGTNTGDANAALMNVAINGADFYTYGSMRFRQTKRAIPTFTFYNPVTGQDGGYRGVSDATNNAATAGAAFIGHTGVGRVYATSSNMTGNYVYAYHYTASAEL